MYLRCEHAQLYAHRPIDVWKQKSPTVQASESVYTYMYMYIDIPCSSWVAGRVGCLSSGFVAPFPVSGGSVESHTHRHTHTHTPHSLTHPPTHSLTRPLTHSLTRPLTHSPAHSLTHSLTQTHSHTIDTTHPLKCSQKAVDFLDMIMAVCMAAFSFLRALNLFSPWMVSCRCTVAATLSRF